MARFRRLVVAGYPHHITQRGVRRQKTFFDELDYQRYLAIAGTLLKDCSITIWAYCLMPNHMHAVVVPQRRDSLAVYFGRLHKQYAQITNSRYEWSGHLWQNRFFSTVMDNNHALVALRYVERNPVRSGLVRSAQEWPWSSARGNLGLFDDPLIPGRPALDVVSNWAAYLSGDDNQTSLATLRKQTCTGRPIGSDRFIEDLERLTGRDIHKRRPGRRKK